jgi:hypothetical protein
MTEQQAKKIKWIAIVLVVLVAGVSALTLIGSVAQNLVTPDLPDVPLAVIRNTYIDIDGDGVKEFVAKVYYAPDSGTVPPPPPTPELQQQALEIDPGHVDPKGHGRVVVMGRHN